MLEFVAMAILSKRLLPILLACVLTLGACAQSRVVRRDYPTEPSTSSARASRSPSRPPSRAAPTPIPANAIHVVRRGETLYGISFRFGLRYQDVAAWNGIGESYLISVGQRLRLRPPQSGLAAAGQPRALIQPASPASPVRPAVQPVLPPVASPSALTDAPPARPPSASPATPPASSPPVTSVPVPPAAPSAVPGSATVPGSPAWRWPAPGQVIDRFVSGDQTRQGINIAGTSGQNVAAAADGVVVYSGAGLVGYGELIIIKHSDEWLSAYAHNRRRLVGEGTRVKAGDVIAELGRTGASRDMLHFEIRRHGKPVDPLGQLPRR